MDKKKYCEYLLSNCFRLKEEFQKNAEDRKICLVDFLAPDEKRDLIKDVTLTIDFYENLDIITREILILRFLKCKQIKEVAHTISYSESKIKKVLSENQKKLANII